MPENCIRKDGSICLNTPSGGVGRCGGQTPDGKNCMIYPNSPDYIEVSVKELQQRIKDILNKGD